MYKWIYFNLLILGLAITSPIKAENIPEERVTIVSVQSSSAGLSKIDMKVFIGKFLLIHIKNIKPDNQRLNKTFNVRSKFTLPLVFQVSTKVYQRLPIPGYIADWDNDTGLKPYCRVNMPWNFNGNLECGNLKIRIITKVRTKGQPYKKENQ